jgi:hypothetical protein
MDSSEGKAHGAVKQENSEPSSLRTAAGEKLRADGCLRKAHSPEATQAVPHKELEKVLAIGTAGDKIR